MTKHANEITLKPSQVMEAIHCAAEVGDSLMIWGSPGIGKSQISQQFANDAFPVPSTVEKTVKSLEREIEVLNNRINYHTEEGDKQELIDELVYARDSAKSRLATLHSKVLDQETNFIDFRLSQVEPSDLRGIPVPVKVFRGTDGVMYAQHELKEDMQYKEETTVVWASPEVFNLPENWKGVIMLDEINSAMPIVQAAAYQLVLDRCIGELKLPKGAVMIAAGNRDGDGGVTFTLATPLRDRLTHIEMQTNFSDWRDFYAIPNGVHPKVIAYLSTAEKFFNTLDGECIGHAGGTTPRSWVRVSDYEKKFDKMSKPVSATVRKGLLAGRLTSGIGHEYSSFCDIVMTLPTLDEIFNGQVRELDADVISNQSKMFFLALNMTYRIIDVNAKFREGEIEVEEYSKYAENFIKFLHKNFSDRHAELVVMSIRNMTQQGCMISRTHAPSYPELQQRHANMIRSAHKAY